MHLSEFEYNEYIHEVHDNGAHFFHGYPFSHGYQARYSTGEKSIFTGQNN